MITLEKAFDKCVELESKIFDIIAPLDDEEVMIQNFVDTFLGGNVTVAKDTKDEIEEIIIDKYDCFEDIHVKGVYDPADTEIVYYCNCRVRFNGTNIWTEYDECFED